MKRFFGCLLFCCYSNFVCGQVLKLAYFVGDTQTATVATALERLQREHPEIAAEVEVQVLSGAQVEEADAKSFAKVDLLLLSLHELESLDRFEKRHGIDLIAAAQEHGQVFGVGDGPLPPERYTERGVLWDDQLREYFAYGGADNSYALLKYLLRHLGHEELEVPSPMANPDSGYYHPDATPTPLFATWDAFERWQREAGKVADEAIRVAVGFYSSYYDNGDMAVIDAVIRAIEARGATAIPFFGYPDEVAYRDLLLDERGRSRADVVMAFSLRFAQPATAAVLAQIDVPIINLITLYGRSAAEWRQSREGLTTFEGTFQMAMPELAGLVAPTVVGSLETVRHATSGLTIVANRPIPEQVEHAVERAFAHASLRRKPNAEKKLALFYYSYPPGRASIGASYLNVPESLAVILQSLREAGYDTGSSSLDADDILDAMTSQAYNVASNAPGELQTMLQRGDAVRVSQEQYREWLEQLPAELRNKINRDWGEPESATLMTEYGENGSNFVIPRLQFGKVIVLPQPLRGWGEDLEKLYHAQDLAPPHQYVATYEWLRRSVGVDAFIHLGTHGTLEWLDGKDSGLSLDDAPEALLGAVPNFYVYNVDVVGEGLVARRRGAAAIVDHMTPPFTEAGIYGEFASLNEAIEEYQLNLNKNPELSALYAEQIRESIESLGLAAPLGLPATDRDLSLNQDTIGRLQDHILELKAQKLPYGLHTFGRLPPEDQVDATVAAIVDTDPTLSGEKAAALARDMRQRIELSAERETTSLLRALSGAYLPGGSGGEPIRNPEAYPTGKNFYGIDPNKVPKKLSWELGVKLAEEMLATHLAENGRYPAKVSFVIWGGETLRHEGVLEAQILHLLGTRPVWDNRDRVVDIEVVPRSQLQRPRVDIVIASAAEGMFGNLTQLLDKAAQQVKNLDEVDNFVRQHFLATRAALIGKGYSAEEAERMAGVRIFDEPPGSHNLNTARIASASGTWDSDLGMANDYIKKMGHGFGNGFWGEPMEDAFRLTLAGVEKVVHSSSSNLYGTLDNDDFFMYMGGLAAAVRSIDGTTPAMLVTDTRDPRRARLTGINEFITTEFRSRYVNPRWIAGMQEEGYAGAAEMTRFVESLWGWDVTVSEVIDEDMWNEVFEVYVADKYELALREFFDAHSPHAHQALTARMLETIRKGYWQADAAQTATLVEDYLESVARHGIGCGEQTCANPRLLQFIVQEAVAAGLSETLIADFETQLQEVLGADLAVRVQELETFVAENEARLERRQPLPWQAERQWRCRAMRCSG